MPVRPASTHPHCTSTGFRPCFPLGVLLESGSHVTFWMAAARETRLRVIALYKELHRLGRDYPDPASVFRLPPIGCVAMLNLNRLLGTTFTRSYVASLRVSSLPLKTKYPPDNKLRDWPSDREPTPDGPGGD